MNFPQILPFPERVIGRKSLPYEAVPTAVYRIHKIPKRFRQKGIERRENKNLKLRIMANYATNIFHARTENQTDLDKIEAFLDDNFNGSVY